MGSLTSGPIFLSIVMMKPEVTCDYDQANQCMASGEYRKAVAAYQHLLNNDSTTEQQRVVAYQNGGAALRRLGELDKAIQWMQTGITRFPNAVGLLHNLGNCYREKGGDSRWHGLDLMLKALDLGPISTQLVVSTTGLLMDLSYPGIAYDILTQWLKVDGKDVVLSSDVLRILLELCGQVLEPGIADPIGTWCLDQLGDLAGDTLAGQAGIAIYLAKLGKKEEALSWFDRAKESLHKSKNNPSHGREGKETDEGEKTFIIAGWNMSCTLLKSGDMRQGWSLFDYGLQTPAAGQQRWQRSLAKPLSGSQVPVWRGEALEGRSILVLGEQAVGDTMMFLQLLPQLLRESERITLLLPSRLVPIYRRTYPELEIINEDDIDQIKQAGFDYQIPCGSIPGHRMQRWLEEGWQQRKLIPDISITEELRARYRERLGSHQKVIGISWKGGGRADRIRVKSIPKEQWGKMLSRISDACFVSLQYGDAQQQVDAWRHEGLEITYDKEINALENMDVWLAQCAACDEVISVANTTVHGAGGLQIPTLCLQSRGSDWRWVNNMEHSYWYESVETVFQNKNGRWKTALDASVVWAHRTKEREKNTILDAMHPHLHF